MHCSKAEQSLGSSFDFCHNSARLNPRNRGWRCREGGHASRGRKAIFVNAICFSLTDNPHHPDAAAAVIDRLSDTFLCHTPSSPQETRPMELMVLSQTSNLSPFYQLWWWFPKLLLLRNLHLLKDNWRNNFWGILLILSILQILAFLGSKDVSVILEQKVLTSSMDNVIYPEAALPHREAGNRETLGQEMRGWQLTESHVYAVLKAKKCCCGGGSPHKYPTPPLLPHYSSQPGWIQDSDDFRFVWVWPSSTSQTC